MVSRAQLLASGWSASAIDRALRAGRLHRVHRGVYVVGHTSLSREARWMAAVLAGGEGAVLSHRSAAELWELVRSTSSPAHVTVTHKTSIDGIAIHRTRRPPEVTHKHGIPVTTVERTLVDLAEVAPKALVDRARHQAEIRYGVGDIEPIYGRRHVRMVVGDHERSRSSLERAFKRLCREAGLEAPEQNVTIEEFEVDFVWREQRVVVETDGWQFHRSRHAFENDRARDAALRRAGYEVLRFTHAQVMERPWEVVAALRAALASAA